MTTHNAIDLRAITPDEYPALVPKTTRALHVLRQVAQLHKISILACDEDDSTNLHNMISEMIKNALAELEHLHDLFASGLPFDRKISTKELFPIFPELSHRQIRALNNYFYRPNPDKKNPSVKKISALMDSYASSLGCNTQNLRRVFLSRIARHTFSAELL